MHPLTRLFNYLKRIDFSMALEREHLSEREQVQWYPEWMYELMETDEIRNRFYQDAIRKSVPGKVVLELGTGRKALWAVCCARAGAKQVYAVEANERAYQESVRFLKVHRIANVHLIRGFSDKIALPERCDVLVHDLIGDIASSEGMIPFIEDAKRRLLTPDALYIPRRATTCVVLAADPRFTAAEWAFSYAMRGFARFDSLPFIRVFGYRPADALSEPYVFEDFEFRQEQPLRPTARLVMEARRDGVLHGAFFFLRLTFGEACVLDTWRSQTTWATPYVRFQAPTAVRKGDHVHLVIQSDLSGNPSYSLQMTHGVDGAARLIGEYAWAGD
jgi:protein arginine N-methyltransferase 1